jgi:hypothetical protein
MKVNTTKVAYSKQAADCSAARILFFYSFKKDNLSLEDNTDGSAGGLWLSS